VRFATRSMGVMDTSPPPPVPRKDDKGAHEQDGEHAPIALNGPRLGGSTHGYTSWICAKRRPVSYVRMAPLRPAEKIANAG
jgi:hypothetical protein